MASLLQLFVISLSPFHIGWDASNTIKLCDQKEENENHPLLVYNTTQSNSKGKTKKCQGEHSECFHTWGKVTINIYENMGSTLSWEYMRSTNSLKCNI